jgi:hypothetical protein
MHPTLFSSKLEMALMANDSICTEMVPYQQSTNLGHLVLWDCEITPDILFQKLKTPVDLQTLQLKLKWSEGEEGPHRSTVTAWVSALQPVKNTLENLTLTEIALGFKSECKSNFSEILPNLSSMRALKNLHLQKHFFMRFGDQMT